MNSTSRSELNCAHYAISVITPLVVWVAITIDSQGLLALPSFLVILLGAVTALPIFSLLPRKASGWAFVSAMFAELGVLSAIGGMWAPVGFEVFAGGVTGAIFGTRISESIKRRRQRSRGLSEPGTHGWHVQGRPFSSSVEAKQQAEVALAALDGSDNHLVTVWNGNARLDIVGDTRTGLVVYCSADSQSEDLWALLLSAQSSKIEADVRIGPDTLRLPQSNIVTAELASRAISGFLEHQAPDPALRWLTGEQAYFKRPPLAV